MRLKFSRNSCSQAARGTSIARATGFMPSRLILCRFRVWGNVVAHASLDYISGVDLLIPVFTATKGPTRQSDAIRTTLSWNIRTVWYLPLRLRINAVCMCV